MIYSARKRALFCQVSRTGGTSLSACLRRALPDANPLLEQHEFLAAARPVLGSRFADAFKFAFVRNPWDRFVSWYAMIGQTPTAHQPVGDGGNCEPDSEHWEGFDAFLESWAAEEVLIDGVKRRKLSQWAQLSDADGTLLTDDLGKFETLADDAERLFQKLGAPFSQLPRLNRSRHHHYSVYYSDFGQSLVADVYREDLEQFGYTFELPDEAR